MLGRGYIAGLSSRYLKVALVSLCSPRHSAALMFIFGRCQPFQTPFVTALKDQSLEDSLEVLCVSSSPHAYPLGSRRKLLRRSRHAILADMHPRRPDSRLGQGPSVSSGSVRRAITLSCDVQHTASFLCPRELPEDRALDNSLRCSRHAARIGGLLINHIPDSHRRKFTSDLHATYGLAVAPFDSQRGQVFRVASPHSISASSPKFLHIFRPNVQ